MKPFTDQKLLEGLKKRNNNVVQYIMEEYFPMIELMVKKMGGDTQDAKDIFQEALIILIVKVDKGEFVLAAKFLTYLYAVSKNLWIYQKNKDKTAMDFHKRYANDIEIPLFAESYDRELQQKVFKYYFEQLSEICQKVLKLYWLEMPVPEIAQKLGRKEVSIRNRKYECKKNLIELIINNPDKI